MKLSITYFYNVRFMKANQLPLSTAAFPPKWWHKNGKSYIDSNNVVNGFTASRLVPQQQCECPCKKKDYQNCSFLKTYYKQLQEIDFSDFMSNLDAFVILLNMSMPLHARIDEIVLLVFEKPDNPCSERTILKKWFAEHGIELNEMEIQNESL